MLERLLLQRKKEILERWYQLISEVYPGDALQLERGKDQFSNPVGHNISREMENLYDGLSRGSDTEKLRSSVSNIMSITAVQNLAPSQAVGLVFLLKKAVRQELSGEIGKGHLSQEVLEFELPRNPHGPGFLSQSPSQELLEFESRIDELCLFAFDAYMERREKIFEIRVREVRNEKDRAFRLLERLDGSCR